MTKNVFAVLGGFIPIYEVYLTLYFISVTCSSANWVSGHPLLLELFGKKKRRFVYCLNILAFTLTGMIMPLLAYLERNWSYMHLYMGLISTISIPTTAFLLAESTRWMILNGKEEEAERELLKIAKWNKKHLTDDEALEMKEIVMVMAETAKIKDEQKLSPLQMFKPAYLSITLIIMTVWISTVLTTYALLLNVTNLAGNIFLNAVISVLFELPSPIYMFACLDRIGRRFSIILTQVIAGSCCTAMAFIPKSNTAWIMALYLIGRLCSQTSLSIAWLFTGELYPTNMRGQSVAACSLVSHFVGMFSSFIVKLGVFWSPLPMLILGVPSLLSGLLTTRLPETSKRRLVEMTN